MFTKVSPSIVGRSDDKKEFRPSQDKDFEANIPRIANNGTMGHLGKQQNRIASRITISWDFLWK